MGGFLAQINVFLAHRYDLLEDRYYREMSAMIFDSPGALDFMNKIASNIQNERNKIKIADFNIHNFCASPTVVSTFGQHIGTIWRLGNSENPRFVMDHKLDIIHAGFNPATIQPNKFHRATTWPAADFSELTSMSGLASGLLSTAAHAPFEVLSGLYRGLQ